ncbi:MAG: hypothetical protein KY468_01615 [Armatimonadetes bacterium]|nr:hypothetical protein [Armatimonadota bacterium]
MNGYREVEELEMTRVEKMLVVGLVVFMLIGGFWVLNRIETLVPKPVLSQDHYVPEGIPIQKPPIEEELGIPALRKQVERLQSEYQQRANVLSSRREAYEEAENAYQFRREEFRTAIEAGRATPALEAAHQQAREVRSQRLKEKEVAERRVQATRAQLKAPKSRLEALENRARRILEGRERTRNLILLALNFLFAGTMFFLSWKAWQRARRAQWRYLSLLTAWFTASVILLIFLTFRYCWEILLQNYTLLGVSLIGIVGCSLAIIALKRYVFSPERVARNRLAARACPNCSTPFTDGQEHCWDCGRPLLEPCPHCGKPHLRYAPHCSHCGREVPLPSAA